LDENGKVIKFFSVHNEITKIKEREFALERSERLLRRMEEAAHIGAWEHDLESGDFFTTKEINRILQYATDKDLTLNEILKRIDTHLDSNAQKRIARLMENGESFDEIVAMNTATRELRQIRIIGKTRKTGSGKGKVYGVFQDVTTSIRSENKLRESKALIEAINKNIQDGIYRSTVNKGLIYANEAFAKIFAYDSVEQVLKADIIRFYHNDSDRSRFLSMMEKEGVVKNFEVRLKRKNGELFWGEISATISKDSRGEICIDGSVRDITALKETQLALLKAKEKAEKASMAKAEFLSVMSHEIRTPMNAVIGMTELLLMEQPREDQMDYLETLKFSAGNLLNIINDILDYSKIDAGRIEFEELEFKPATLLNSLVQSIQPRISEKDVALKMELDPQIPDIIIGDPTRLSQVLTNLLSNAAKFTARGQITLEAKVEKKSKDGLAIRFAVRDTGIGIPKAKQSEIFKSFAQADASITRKYGGTGLGLAITKRLLELQGSQICLKSKPGKGSEFYFVLNFRYDPKQQPGEPALNGRKSPIETRDLSGMHVLIVEDNIINLKLTERFLQKWNARTDSAKNGLEGFQKIKDNPDTYDAVLMDLQMPVMDGYTATARIREINTQIPILALTASAMLEIQERVYASGMNDYITKPINAQELNVKLSKYRKS
jgi:PAS domain S-box-containing protein